jgi:DNA adenine methylase
MDPPYFGTSTGRDRRYAASLSVDDLVLGLRSLKARDLRFALSYDGACGTKTYGPPLPDDLIMHRFTLDAGRSSQATLNGLNAKTTESLYISV